MAAFSGRYHSSRGLLGRAARGHRRCCWRRYFLIGAYGWIHLFASHGAYYLVEASAQLGATPPQQGEDTRPEGPPTPGATRSRANKIAPQRADPGPALPTATGAEQTVR